MRRALLLCAVVGSAAVLDGQAQTGIRIGVLGADGYAVRVVPLDDYVGRVLAGEAAPNTAPAALDALAIAVRTYTASNLGKHRAQGFDLCDQTHCQVMRTANADTARAAAATAGLILLDGAAAATIYYSASCGGRTERPSAVWPGAADLPHLPSQDDEACRGFPAWSAELAAADLQRALQAGGFRGTLRDVRILSRHPSGRVDRLALEGMTPPEISGQDLRMVIGPVLGWMRILSTTFELRRSGTAYRFTGRGSGHGVGMCVIGAMHRADAGASAEEILSQYYPGLRIAPYVPRPAPAAPAPAAPRTTAAAPPPERTPAPAPADPVRPRADVVVALPEAGSAERPRLESFAAAARDELAAALGVAAPPRIELIFHASAEDFERATGRRWFFSGAGAEGRLHFLPVTVLRDRGVLERTIRRVLAAALTGEALAGRPAWVRDGIAIYYADPQAEGDARGVCPSPIELDQPVSAGALSDAYARARACVARQIRNGRAWQEIR